MLAFSEWCPWFVNVVVCVRRSDLMRAVPIIVLLPAAGELKWYVLCTRHPYSRYSVKSDATMNVSTIKLSAEREQRTL